MMESAISLALRIILPFWLIGLAYFLCLLRDISRRRENRLLWLALILIFGPFAIAAYKAKQKLVTGGDARGDLAYNLTRHLMLPWSLYLFIYPILFLLFDLFGRGVAFWAEHLYWLALAIVIVILPLWLITMVLLLIIRLVRARRTA